MTTFVIINPGAGPVPSRRGIDGNTARNADSNIRHFIRDMSLGRGKVGFHRRPPQWSREDGRYMYTLNYGRRKCAVDMPGLDLSRVRFRKDSSDSAWDFPRLYVDGSSWLWPFAVDMAIYALTKEEE